MDTLVIYMFIGLWGAVIGSFLNLCIYRLPRGETVVYGGSRCTNCGQGLQARDLIPVISYLWLRGRCRHCDTAISGQYPLVELCTAALFVVIFMFWGLSWQTVLMWVLGAILICASVIDWRHRIIPDELIITGLCLGLPLTWLVSTGTMLAGVGGFLLAGSLLLLIALVSRGGMGGGDIKLGAVMGLYLGWSQVLVALFAAFLAGGITGILLMATRGWKRKDAVPFGPFLALGSLLAAFYGQQIISWYLSLCR